MISVIVPAYNSEKTIERCLRSLESQTYSKDSFEIIVVDDGSTDKTKKIVRHFPNVRYYNKKNEGPAAARNFGAKQALGDILLFIDSDCEADEQWISEMVRPFEQPSTQAVKGIYRTKQKGLVSKLVQIEFEERYDKMARSKGLDFMDFSAGAIRKATFDQQGGFRQDLKMSEDVQFAYQLSKAGHTIVFTKKAIVYHSHPATVSAYLKVKFWRSFWRMEVYKNFPKKILRDSYTPQTLKLQIVGLFTLLLSAALLPMVPEVKYFLYAVLFGLFIVLVPLTFRAFKSGIIEGLLMPFFIIGRALSLGLGVLYYFFEIKNFRELIAFITIVLIIVVPSFFTGGLDLIARTIVFILIFPALFFAIRSDKPAIKERIPLKYNIFIPLGIFFIIAGVLVFFSVSPYESYSTLIHWISYALLFLAVYYLISSRAEAFKFAYVIIFLAVILSVIGTYFFIVTEHYSYLRLVSTFYQHNPFAGFLLFALPLSYAFLFYADSAKKRWIFLAITAFLTLAFALTHSRGAWISFIVPFALLLFFKLRSTKKIAKTLGIVAVIALTTVAGWWGLTQIKEYQADQLATETQTEVAVQYSVETTEENAYVARLHFWDGARRIITDHPIAGTGLDTYKIMYRQYLQDIRYYTIDPHNIYLKMLAELGVIGALPFFWFIGVVFFVVLIGMRKVNSLENKNDTALVLGLAAGILGSMAHNFVELDWQFPTNMIVFFVVLAVYYKVFIINQAARGSLAKKSGESIVNHRVFQGSAVILAFVVLVGGSLQFVSSTFAQDAENKKIDMHITESETLLNKAIMLDPLNSRLHLKLAEVYFLLIPDDIEYYKEQYTNALQKAISLSPEHYLAYTVLGRHYALLKNYEEAEIQLLKSIELNPIGDPSVYPILAAVYNDQERFTDARVLLEGATALYDPAITHSVIWIVSNKSSKTNSIAEIHNLLGLEYARSDDLEDAKKEFMLGLEYNSQDQQLIENLAGVSLRLMDPEDTAR